MRTISCSDYLAQRQDAEVFRAMEWELAASALQHQRTPLWSLLAIVGIHSPRERFLQGQRRAMRLEAQIAQREAENWYKGQQGEHMLYTSLSARLDDRFLLLRNWQPQPPNHVGGDIDALLIGPHGVTVFEVKALTGEYMVAGERWLWRANSRGRWQPARADPSGQALRNAERVRRVLRFAGAGRVRVQAAVAVASPEMRIVQMRSPRPFLYFACRGDATIEPIVGRAGQLDGRDGAATDWLAGILLTATIPREPVPAGGGPLP